MEEMSPTPTRHGHPVMGIVSFVIPTLTVAGCLGLYALTYLSMIFTAGSLPSSFGRRGFSDIPPAMYGMVGSASLLGLCLLAAPILSLIGLILAAISYRRPDTERTFPTLGVIANGTLVVYACLIVGMVGFITLATLAAASR